MASTRRGSSVVRAHYVRPRTRWLASVAALGLIVGTFLAPGGAAASPGTTPSPTSTASPSSSPSSTASSSSTPTKAPLKVTAKARPGSGGKVAPGATIRYTLHAKSTAPLAAGTKVVDDLSGLLRNASVATSKATLAKRGLSLNTGTKKLTWTVPASAASANQATTSFKATVAPDAARGTKLATTAFPQGGTCSAGQPCATTLTVAGAAKSAAATPTRKPAADPSSASTPKAAAVTPLNLPTTCSTTQIFNIAGLSSGSSPNAGNFYALDTTNGANTFQGRFGVTGTGIPGAQLNGLAVTPDLSAAYAVAQTNGTTIYTHTRAGVNTSVSAASTGRTMVMGGYDPVNGIYYYAGYSGTTLGIWGYRPGVGPLGQLVNVTGVGGGTTPTNSTGDLAFNSLGDAYLVTGQAAQPGGTNSQIRLVNGGRLPTSGPVQQRTTQVLASHTAPGGTGFYNGIAFGADGVLYAQYATQGSQAGGGSPGDAVLQVLDPDNGNVLRTENQSGEPAGAILTDLAGCALPGTLNVRKDLPNGRARTGDQFRMTVTGDGMTEGNVATTTGNATGIQTEQIGPRPAVTGIAYTISEELAPGSPSSPGDYETTWSCTNNGVAFMSGDGRTINIDSFPPPVGTQGANVVCTFTNTPGPPNISIVKSADPTTFDAADTLITYTYEVRNTGNVTLTDVRVTDPHPGLSAITCVPPQGSTLEPDETMTCTATYTTTQADVNAGRIENTGTVVGTPPGGPPDSVTDSDSETVTAGHAPNISITKSAEPDTFSEAGTPITYTYRVVNNGNVTLTDVRVTDPHPGLSDITCDPEQGSTLHPTETMTCTATYTTTQADVNAGSIHNTGTVVGTPPGGPPDSVTDEDTATVELQSKPDIGIVKTASRASFTAAGQTITYTYRVTNTGNVPLTDVRVTDDKAGTATCPQTTLAVGEHMDCTATYTTTAADVAAGRVTNVGTATGTGPNGEEVKADSSVTVPFTPSKPKPPKPPTPPPAPAPTPPSQHAPKVPVTG